MTQPDLLLVALNARYIHTNPAVSMLAAYCRDAAAVRCAEFTADQPIDRVLGDILRLRPRAVGFSCYLWNVERALALCDALRRVLPRCPILLGGPEVSFDSAALLQSHEAVDLIVRGEGEETLRQWLLRRRSGESADDLPGTTVRTASGVRENPPRPPLPMEALPFPYDDLTPLRERILYYESSRGCPFSCAYCLSSAEGDVRFRPLAQTLEHLDRFLAAGVRQVKLVDRTFNADPERARRIFAHLLEARRQWPDTPINYHFEMSGALMDRETLAVLGQAPPGFFQAEIGVQSTHEPTLRAVGRGETFAALAPGVRALIKHTAVPVHLDLIAGMPRENLQTFARSFDETYRLGPDRLQLGFLKLLRGTPLRRDAEALGIRYAGHPPYEVLATPDLSWEELLRLKDVEAMTELFHNSRNMTHTMACLTGLGPSPFAFFDGLAAWWREKGHFERSHGIGAQFGLLGEYAASLPEVNRKRLGTLLRFDWALLEKPRRTLPGWPSFEPPDWKRRVRELYRDRARMESLLPRLAGMPPQQLARMCHVEAFSPPVHPECRGDWEVILFDYSVPGRTAVHPVPKA